MEDSESLVQTTFVKSSETDSVRPVTVYQALRSERSDDNVEFTLDGVKFSKVLLVTHVILSSDTSDVRGSYNLEDGTGSIRGSLINRVGQDPLRFSAKVRQFDGVLARVIGKLAQFSNRKSIEIEVMIPAGYHQAMFHTLECMKLSLTIGRLGEVPAPNAEGTVRVVTPEPEREVSHAYGGADSHQLHYSFFDLPENDQGEDVNSVQIDAPLPQSYADHGEGSSSYLELIQAASRLPSPRPLPAPGPEAIHSAISQVADSHAFPRTPSPLSSFGSALRISPLFQVVSYYGQRAQLRETQLAIVSSLSQLQGNNTPYGVWISDVFESVSQAIEITQEEFIADIEWLLEEAYIVKPLDDDRIALTPRGSA